MQVYFNTFPVENGVCRTNGSCIETYRRIPMHYGVSVEFIKINFNKLLLCFVHTEYKKKKITYITIYQKKYLKSTIFN